MAVMGDKGILALHPIIIADPGTVPPEVFRAVRDYLWLVVRRPPNEGETWLARKGRVKVELILQT
jgi:hypothetical protein